MPNTDRKRGSSQVRCLPRSLLSWQRPGNKYRRPKNFIFITSTGETLACFEERHGFGKNASFQVACCALCCSDPGPDAARVLLPERVGRRGQ
eukprot:1918227-Rhodomonas_salina.3